ncbi:MAG TPA: ribose-5-phosphate isomerase RpiA [Acidimicrobiales bacterium]|nr:ribose-5-phosphate isomerase RpiA [Acidimicrobiales bacterium]
MTGTEAQGGAAITDAKRMAGEWAADQVTSGSVVGLGTGSTAVWAVRRLAERLATGELTDVVGIPTSVTVATIAAELGIPIGSLGDHPVVDLTIDGADEVDAHLNLIKGGGGALLREKIVAQASRREIIVVDESKLSPALGTLFRLPVEVIEFGWRPEAEHLLSLGFEVSLRRVDGQVFRTDEGNVILDCTTGPIDDPADLDRRLTARAGVVETGLFCGLATDLVVGGQNGVTNGRP